MGIVKNIRLAVRIVKADRFMRRNRSLKTICACIRDCLNLLVLEAMHAIYNKIES